MIEAIADVMLSAPASNINNASALHITEIEEQALRDGLSCSFHNFRIESSSRRDFAGMQT